MGRAALPVNEADRLEELRSYRVLDTLPEPAYDDIAAIASQICHTPIALVSLVDDQRQWFKAKVGVEASETPRDVAFCAHAILDPEALLVVEDASQDERFADNSLVVSGPKIRFYAGAPLVSASGHALGTLCVIDREPRHLDARQTETLRALSRQVVAQLELRRTLSELASHSRELKRSNAALQLRTQQLESSSQQLAELCGTLRGQADIIERDLHRAEVIQRSLLPHDPPAFPNYCVQTLYRPGRNIGGDLFDVVGIGERYVALVIADAAGHGVSAAMLSVVFKNRLRVIDEATGEPLRPSQALAQINESLRVDLPAPGVFVTAAFCLLDTETHELVIASAGHPPVIWLKANGETEQIEHTGPALGLYPHAEFSEQTVVLSKDDRILLYTDGLFDCAGDGPSECGTIAQALRGLGPGERVLESVLMAVSQGRERKDRDDVTMLLLEACAGTSRFDEASDDFQLAAASEPDEPRITTAENSLALFLSLHGRVTWIHAAVLLDAAQRAIERARPLILDLAGCERLDSTMLGTLHEVVERGDSAAVSVCLQQASPALRTAFRELSMHSVVSRMIEDAVDVPAEQTPLDLPEGDIQGQHRRLLRAHEVLAQLSEENRKQFGPVAEMFRAEIDESAERS